MRRRNIQHGRARRMPRSTRLPITIILIELAALAWLLPIWVDAVIAQ